MSDKIAEITATEGIDKNTFIHRPEVPPPFIPGSKGHNTFRMKKIDDKWFMSDTGIMVIVQSSVLNAYKGFKVTGYPFKGNYVFAEPVYE